MSGTNDNSPKNGRLAIAVVGALAAVAVALVNNWPSWIGTGELTSEGPSPPKPTLRITSLASGGRVAFDSVVDGEAAGPIEQVWLVVQTRQMPPECWVHGPAGLDENRTWHIPAQFGRSRSLDSGSRFSVAAIAGAPGETRPGNVSCALAPAVRSPSVEVVRQ